ncbi:MAG: ribbon-helix-helix protein, CopG family [Nitrospirota bacterium]
MRAVISISLPEKMASELDRAVKETGRAKSEIVKEALRAYLWEESFRKTKKRLVSRAKTLGIVTDEDVFKIVS